MIAGGIYFQEFWDFSFVQAVSFTVGVLVSIVGVAVLSRRDAENIPPVYLWDEDDPAIAHLVEMFDPEMTGGVVSMPVLSKSQHADKHRRGAVNLWAFDFVVDADLRPYVLEGNGGASTNYDWQQTGAGGRDDYLMTTAIELAAKVQMKRWRRDAPVLHHGGWELVYNEAGDRCDGGYDPCALFKGQAPADIAAAWPYAAPEWPLPGAPFEVATGAGRGVLRTWYGENAEEILRKTVGAGLEFRD